MHIDQFPETPIDPNFEGTGGDARPVTSRSKSALDPILQWAAKLGLDDILLCLIFAGRTNQQTDYFGTTFHFLLDSRTHYYIQKWAPEIACGDELLNLIEGASLAVELHSTYPALPSAKPADQQLTGGHLSAFPLVALLLRPIPKEEQINSDWIAALRVWLFALLVDSVYLRTTPNPLLIEVIGKLRMGIDVDPNWLKLFNRLHVNTDSLHGIKRELAQMSRSLLTASNDAIERQSHRTLLSTLYRLCTDDSPDDQSTQFHEEYESFLSSLYRSPRSYLPSEGLSRLKSLYLLSQESHRPDQEDTTPTTINFDEGEGKKSGLIVNETDEFAPPGEQEVKSHGVLLSTIESHQHLPYSWNNLTQKEKNALFSWTRNNLINEDKSVKLLASLVYIGIVTSYSLETVLDIPLNAPEWIDWRIDLQSGELIRPSPRRQGGWTASPQDAPWIENFEVVNRIKLHPLVLSILIDANKPPGYQDLRNIWYASETARPATKFDRACKNTNGMERIRSGMLSGIVKQSAFAETLDPTLADLLSSHSNSGLPGACAYAAYPKDRVTNVMGKISNGLSNSSDAESTPAKETDLAANVNAAGSQLSPLDTAIEQALYQAYIRLEELSNEPTKWLEHHNAATAYMVVLLLATTAARPVTSPFESIRHIDWNIPAVYVQDKVSSKLHEGRLIPIPKWIAQLIQEFYLKHLVRLSVSLSKTNPILSKEIVEICSGNYSPRIPFFFLLSNVKILRWIEVSESTLTALDLFKWPLPWNLMRHRLVTQLKREGLDSEIINGITGHGESGTDAYGEYSVRCWLDDAQTSEGALTNTLSRLNLRTPHIQEWEAKPVEQDTTNLGTEVPLPEITFGAVARAKRRQVRHRQAESDAINEIEHLINKRPIDSLSPQNWEDISMAMLFHEDGRPRTLGSLRYDTLNKWIQHHWQNKGQRPRIKRRYIPTLEESSPFNEKCIHANDYLKKARSTLQQFNDVHPISKQSLRLSLLLGIINLTIFSRIADLSVLKDLLLNKNYRIVKFSNKYFLEHSPGLGKVATNAVRRYRVSEITAEYFAHARSSSISINVSKLRPPEFLRKIGCDLNLNLNSDVDIKRYITECAAIVSQSNYVRYPGIIAAYLNGDIVSVGLSHSDWIRCHSGKSPIINLGFYTPYLDKVFKDADKPDDDDLLAINARTGEHYTTNFDVFTDDTFVGPRSKVEKLNAAHLFFSRLRSHLNAAEEKEDDFRKTLDSSIKSTVSEYRGKVSISCRLLGEWLRFLTWRRSGKGYIEISSLKRYLNSLSICFEAVAYDHDLISCEEEEVTDFYLKVVEARKLIRSEVSPDTVKDVIADSVIDESASKVYRTQHLAFQLLRDFHKLVSSEYGVEDPDWSDICVDDSLLSISPGILTESEYINCLQHILIDPNAADRSALARGFILLAAYRFGLRGREVTGLLRSDWIEEEGGAIVILVRPNRHRKLKTQAAQRQVPLLFSLCDFEKSLLTRWFASFDGISSLTNDDLLFSDEGGPNSLMNERLLRWQVSNVIKEVTQNSDLSLHHARHSFVNYLTFLLLDDVDGLWPFFVARENFSTERRNHVRRLLLCTDAVTRRSIWATSRASGHAHPRTTVRSYLHILPDLSDKLVNCELIESHKPTTILNKHCIDLDSLPSSSEYLSPPSKTNIDSPYALPTAPQCLHFLRLLQKGVNADRVEFTTRIASNVARDLITSVVYIDEILQSNSIVNQRLGGKFNLLSHITSRRWNVLINMAHSLLLSNRVSPDLLISIDEIKFMVGVSRQILLWRPIHFKFFGRFLSYWSLSPNCYRILFSQTGKPKLEELLRDSNISLGVTPHKTGSYSRELAPSIPASPIASSKKSTVHRADDFVQIDSVHLSDDGLKVSRRCGVLTQSHNDSELRSSHEMLLLFLITVVMESHFSPAFKA